jgi:enoyl-CoA hydratase/carnithine racemase
MDYQTIIYEMSEHIATITLNRPEKLNSFNQRMLDEFTDVWSVIRNDDDVHCVVLRAAGDRAFCTGVDVKERINFPANVFVKQDPGNQLSPKHNSVWKPVVCAVHGMAAGGAFYWINESDIVICSEDASFFDPHVSYGMVAALEPVGLLQRIPLGEVLRIALLGLDERMSPQRALEIGLVSEVVSRYALWGRARELAHIIAQKPPAAIQGTVKAIWQSMDMTRTQALEMGMAYTQIGNPEGTAQVDRATLVRPEIKMR